MVPGKPAKKGTFTSEERAALVKKATAGFSRTPA